MRAILFFITLIYALFIANIIQAQSLSGIITNEEGESIPYANIFIKELGTGTSCDFEGKFFMTLETAQEYNLVISALGYESKNVGVLMTETENYEVTAILQTSSVQMEEIIVRAKKKDPAFGIIKKVIDAKDKYIHPVSSSTSEIYLKSYEKVDITKKKKEENKVEEELFTNPDGSPIDPFEQENKKLRFIASYENGKGTISLQRVGPDNPFYGLSDSDNMIVIHSKRYSNTPLVVRGPGAGAAVTAAGVLAEVISISSSL